MNSVSRTLRHIVAATAVTALLAGCGGAEERKAKYLERGIAFFEEENLDKAVIELRNVLQIDPKTADAHYYLGQVYERRQNWRKAFSHYTSAVELDDANLEAKVKLARFYMLSNQLPNAQAQITDVLTADPANIDARSVQAAILVRQDDRDGARKLIDEILADQPHEPSATMLLASLNQRAGNIDEAIALLEGTARVNVDNAAIQIQLAQAYADVERFKDADDVMSRLIESYPDRKQYRVALANFLSNAKMEQRAETVLSKMLEDFPEEPDGYLLVAEFYMANGRPEDAFRSLEDAIKENPGLTELRVGLGRLRSAQGDLDSAEKVYLGIIEEYEEGDFAVEARALLAELYLARGDTASSQSLVDQALEIAPQDLRSLTVRGKLALHEKDYVEAVSVFRSALKQQPDSIELLNLLAEAHAKNGEFELARDAMEKVIEVHPGDVDARARLVQFLMGVKQMSLAESRLEDAMARFKGNSSLMLLQSDLLSATARIDEGVRVLDQIKAQEPDNAEAYFRAGRIYMAKKQYEKARMEFEQTLELRPNAPEAMEGLTNSLIALGELDEAEQRVKALLAKSPAHATAHDLLGAVYMNKKQYADAISAFEEHIGVAPDSHVGYLHLAAAEVARGDLVTGLAAFDRGLARMPKNLQLLMGKAGVYEREKDFDNAIGMYEKVLEVQSDNLVATNNLAVLLVDHRGDEASVTRALELATAMKDVPQAVFQDTVGWVHHKAGDQVKAKEVLTAVVAQAPEVGVFRYHLGMVLEAAGDSEGAKAELQKAVDLGGFGELEDAKAALAGMS